MKACGHTSVTTNTDNCARKRLFKERCGIREHIYLKPWPTEDKCGPCIEKGNVNLGEEKVTNRPKIVCEGKGVPRQWKL